MANNNNNTGKKFSTFDIFPMQDGFYAIAEGNLTRDPSFSNSEGKKSFISTSMGCGEYPISTRARSVGLPVPEGVNITFANLRFFGKKAEELNAHAKKGDKLVVAGKIGYSKTEKNGNTYHNLDITVDEFFVRMLRTAMPAAALQDSQMCTREMVLRSASRCLRISLARS